MSFKQFIDQLFQFCLGRRRIVWEPAPALRGSEVAFIGPLFEDIIGNAVLNTCIEFQQDVYQHSTALWNYISNSPVPAHYFALFRRIDRVFDAIHANENYESIMQATYVFLAVMVDVATQAALNGNRLLVQNIIRIIVFILDSPMPYDFIQNFHMFLLYAFRHGQPPGN